MQKENTRSRKRYFSVKQLAEYLGLPEGTIYDFASQGTFPSIKIGRRVLFDIVDIDEFLASKKRGESNPDETTNRILKEIGEI